MPISDTSPPELDALLVAPEQHTLLLENVGGSPLHIVSIEVKPT